MEIIGKIDKPLWYEIKCNCGTEFKDKFPLIDCLHCKFEKCEKSLPKQDFTIKDKDGNPTTINKITIVRGSRYQDIIGWSF
jgi:hypothetical protein